MKRSHISKAELKRGEEIKGHDIREGVFNLIKTDYPDFNKESSISLDELNQYRRLYLSSLIMQESGEIAGIDQDVIDAVRNNKILSENINDEINAEATFGQRVADKPNTVMSCCNSGSYYNDESEQTRAKV